MSLNLTRIKKVLDTIDAQYKGRVAQIGLPSGKNYEDGTPVAYVAAIQEFGAPAMNIPPRPFFMPTVANKKKEWAVMIGKGVKQVLAGNLSADEVLEAVGQVAAADLRETINSVNSPALKPATIARKGFNKPLIDTGFMIASIQSKVANRGEDFST